MYFVGEYKFSDENLKGSYLKLKYLSKNEAVEFAKKIDKLNESNNHEALIDASYDLVAEKFIEGKIYNYETDKLEDITKEDLSSIPPMYIGEIILFLRGMLKKN